MLRNAQMACRQVLDTWNIDGLGGSAIPMITFQPQGTKMTIGPREPTDDDEVLHIKSTRPESLYAVFMLQPAGTGRIQMRIRNTISQVVQYRRENVATQYVNAVFYEHTYPDGTLHFDTIPDGSREIELYYWPSLDLEQNLDTDINLPAGFAAALHYAVAAEIMVLYSQVEMLDYVKRREMDLVRKLKHIYIPIGSQPNRDFPHGSGEAQRQGYSRGARSGY